MADIDIDPFGEHESRTDETLILIHLESMNRELMTILRQVIIFPSPQWEDQFGNQTEESKKLHSEENLKEPN